MGHLKMSTDQVKRAILSCDTSILSEARLSQMETFAPDKREVSFNTTKLILIVYCSVVVIVIVYCSVVVIVYCSVVIVYCSVVIVC